MSKTYRDRERHGARKLTKREQVRRWCDDVLRLPRRRHDRQWNKHERRAYVD